MKPTIQNFTRIVGDNYPIKIKLFKSTDIPMDITGGTLTLKILNALGTSVEFTIIGDIIVPIDGEGEFAFESTEFTTVGKYKYEIEFISQFNIKYTIANGTFDIIADLE
jgi:hypothetical protein